MVHEIRWWDVQPEDNERFKLLSEFGYGQADCRVLNYWDPGYPLAASDAEAKTLLLVRGGECFLVACTWNPEPRTVSFRFDMAALGVKPTLADDAERDSALAARRQKVEQAKTAQANALKQAAAAETALKKAANAATRERAEKNQAAAQAAIQKAEAALAAAEKVLAEREAAFARNPLAWDAPSATLTVPLDGYGVRLIRLK